MTDEQEKPENLNGNEGDEAQGASGTEPEKPEEDTEQGSEDVQDKHGQPGINREKYQRDIEKKDQLIEELKKELDEKAKTEEGREKLNKRIDDLEAQLAEEKINHKLELAGCRNVKAGKALLADYDGDVKKLKEAEPWLFKEQGATGFKPSGGNSNSDEERINRALGLKSKDK